MGTQLLHYRLILVSAGTKFATPVSLTPLANDVSYRGTSIEPGSIDLDPTTPGEQASITVFGGTFAAQSNGTVLFTPAPGFSGKTQASYTVTDSRGNVSNPGLLQITVAPDPNAALVLFSFEFGTDGWAYPPWQANGGTTSQTTAFAIDGTHGLQNPSRQRWLGRPQHLLPYRLLASESFHGRPLDIFVAAKDPFCRQLGDPRACRE